MIKTASRIVATTALIFGAFAIVATLAPKTAQAAPEAKINICHATNSNSNPWEAIEISESAWSTHEGHGDFLYTGPVGNNGNPAKEGDAWCADNTTEEVVNYCPLPSTLGDTTHQTINDSGEKTVQEILNDSSYSDVDAINDQVEFQIWNVSGSQNVTITPTFFDKYSSNSIVFGYYRNGDINTFVPVFRKGSVVGYESVIEGSVGDSYNLTVSGASSIGFAIKTSSNETFATENGLNYGGLDMTAIYNPTSDLYIVAFEDWVNGDYDYNDLVVDIKLGCSQGPTEPEIPQICSVVSDTSAKVIEIKIGNDAAVSVNQSAMLVSTTTITEQYWTAALTGPLSTSAKWIWSEDPVENWETNKWVTFTKQFAVTDANTSATLTLAADNYYTVSLDDNVLDINNNNSYGTNGGVSITIPSVSVGTHTLKFVVQNLEQAGEAINNPGSLIFKLALDNTTCDNGNGGDHDPSNNKPTITLVGNSEMNLTIGQTFVDPGANASDAEDGNFNYPTVTAGFNISGQPPLGTLTVTGDYTITYQYCDSQSLCSDTITRTVHVVAGTTQCSDTTDNDGDSFVDANDPQCHTDGNNNNPSSYDPNDNNEGTDACSNLEGDQSSVPEGYTTSEGICTPNGTGGGDTDYCPNIEGVQTSVPEGKVVNNEGNCVDSNNGGGGDNGGDNGGGNNTDVCPNIPGNQNEILTNYHMDSGLCVPDSTGGGGGSGGGSSSGSSRRGGGGGGGSIEFMGGGDGIVLGATTDCGIYLNDYIKYGANNNPTEVLKLQSFFNEFFGTKLALTGVYDNSTLAEVNKFQVKYSEEVLGPWIEIGLHDSLNVPTGYVYKTTKRKINDLVCPAHNLQIPDLTPEMKANMDR
jgi:hypothetical protein